MLVALTGGATGIGASVAEKLKSRGATVTAFDLHEPKENVDHWIKIDLNDPVSIASAVEQAPGPFDALINNAGLPPREGLAETVLKVNYFGLRQFMTLMLDKISKNGSIVNIASRAGSMWRENIDEVKALAALQSIDEIASFVAERGIDPVRAYNLSKEAVIALNISETESLLDCDLRINSISPAAVATDILVDFKTAFGDRDRKSVV